MRRQSTFPHPIVTFLLFILPPLTGLPVTLLAQNKKPSRSELNKIRIDSIFKAAEQNELNTKGVLRYEFYFSDHDEDRFPEFSERMKKDSFESDVLHESEKTWYLTLFKNATYSRESIFDVERKLRGLKYRYYIDHYAGFSIHAADPNPVAVPIGQYSTYLQSLSDEQLFWVGKRLLDLKLYDKALFALEVGVQRQYKQDTATYHYGLAFVATNEPNDGINQWKKAVKLNTEYLEVFLALGKIHFENGYFEKALEYYQRADTLHPNDSQILLHNGETLYALEQFNQSYSYAMRSYDLDSKNVFTRSLLKLLNEPRVKYLRRKFPEK